MEKMRRLLESVWHKILAVGRKDPRRVIHSLKVGVALALVSLLCLLEPFFDGVGANVIWAVMTVVLVLKYTAEDLALVGGQEQEHSLVKVVNGDYRP
ncbi:hypothetical protein MRB53_025402 [Persea americana]|uniref:Uncharacterized protein n=1 Tax=Persea americana TaxID=3435 RepID=A0ACC2LF51_PERAE|nr:hypothetical protein MRB53_025402 [Persea americana]